MTGRSTDRATVDARKASAETKRARIGQRNRWLRIGARVMPDAQRVRIRDQNRRNQAQQHGHEFREECERCDQTRERMRQRGTL